MCSKNRSQVLITLTVVDHQPIAARSKSIVEFAQRETT